MTGFVLNMAGFVLNMTGFVLNMTKFVHINFNIFVRNMTRLPQNMTGSVLNMTEFVLYMPFSSKYYCMTEYVININVEEKLVYTKFS